MRVSVTVALAFGAVLAVPIVAAGYDTTPIHKPDSPVSRLQVRPAQKIEPSSTAPFMAQPEPNFFPYIAPPYPPGQGDTDGLSRNPDDCNKGCIGGNPG